MPANPHLPRGFITNAEKIAVTYREELGLLRHEPLDAFKLAEHLDVPIFTVSELFEEDRFQNEKRILTTPENFSATWMPNEDGDKIIIHNNHHSPARQQSNLMHELAHIICKHEIPTDIARLCLQLGLHYYNKKQEEEASCLGRTLQITREGLVWALRQGYSKQEIATYYNASLDMVNFRINATGVLRQVKGRW